MSEEKDFTKEEKATYARGFNHGYELERENPETMNALRNGIQDKKSLYFQGLDEGSQELKREKFREELQKSKEKRQRNKEKGKDFDR